MTSCMLATYASLSTGILLMLTVPINTELETDAHHRLDWRDELGI